MADRQDPPANPASERKEAETNLHLHQGLGVGARELSSIGESGEKGTLEQDLDEEGQPRDATIVGADGRSASVLDRGKDDEQLSRTSDA
ncbi:hypothetical protein [Brevundimonas vesicularis]|uniref:hypothetical protein n=1 Tax=Brevundimonas vesicularis TaxID=41276 RepID=UPI0038D49CCE